MKSFMDRIFLLFHFVLCCTQQNAMLGNCNFQKKSGGARAPPGPNDATPMVNSRKNIGKYCNLIIANFVHKS